MGLKLEVKDQSISQLQKTFAAFDEKVLKKALRRTLSRSAITFRKLIVQELKKERRMPAKDIKKHIKMRKSLRGGVDKMFVEFSISNRPLPLIRFVKGRKKPEKQRGKKVSRRRKGLRVEIKPGKTTLKKGLFIARTKQATKGNKGKGFPRDTSVHQVFRRETSKSLSIKKQSAPSLAEAMKDKRVMRKIEREITKVMAERFEREMDFFISKALKQAG